MKQRRLMAMTNPMLDMMLDMQQQAFAETFKMWDRFRALPKVPRHAMRVQVGRYAA